MTVRFLSGRVSLLSNSSLSNTERPEGESQPLGSYALIEADDNGVTKAMRTGTAKELKALAEMIVRNRHRTPDQPITLAWHPWEEINSPRDALIEELYWTVNHRERASGFRIAPSTDATVATARTEGEYRTRIAAALLARIRETVDPDSGFGYGEAGRIFSATEYDLADAVLTVRDAEMAELRAEVERLRKPSSHGGPTSAMTFDLPLDGPDPCPQACGGMTEDPYGGPCKRCWEAIQESVDGEDL